MTANKPALENSSLDPADDAPEFTEELAARADFYVGGKLIRRGRPKSESPKELISIRLSPDVLAHFRASGPGWQTRIDEVLREVVRKAGLQV